MCGICATDKHTYRGETTQYTGTLSEQTSPFPMIPGHEEETSALHRQEQTQYHL